MKINALQEYLYESVKKYRNRIAICYQEHDMTYQELYDRSEYIREVLMGCGVHEGSFVGIYMEKTDLTVAAIFGVLSCNAAYIPLDTMYSPASRIADIVEETQIQVILSSHSCITKLMEEMQTYEILTKVKILILDDENDSLEQGCSNIVSISWGKSSRRGLEQKKCYNSENIAYILFTSGSTGKPKGVMISHQNAITFVEWCCSYFKPNQEDHFLSVAPFHFDLSIFDLYVSIASGGCLVIVPAQKERNLLNYLEYIRRYKISYIYSVPSLWIAFLRFGHLKIGELSSITHVLFAGEVFQPEALKKTMEYVPNARFFNLYGLIETNVFTYYEVVSKDSIGEEPVPIGYVCDSSEAVILKGDQEVVEVGEEGELCMCGPILMKGYYNNEELTNQVIRKSPLTRHQGKLLFHTGDVVKLNSEGAYVFVGRNDFLVKKNGFRIELGEIETAITSVLGIEEAAVVAIKDEKQMTIICAAVTTSDDTKFSVRALKEKISERIPLYMIPDYICLIDEFQRSPNGKIDREYLKRNYMTKYLQAE